MSVGHAAVALAATKWVPRLNLGWLIFASVLADFLLGIFAFFGLEHATAPPNFSELHYLWFTFPYSHGLAPLMLWSTIAGFLISRTERLERKTVFIVVSFVALSHFLLDGLVHSAGLPLWGRNSPKLGLGLWNHMYFELSLETVMAALGIFMFLHVAGKDSPAMSRIGVPCLIALLTLLTWSQLSLVVVPPTNQLAPGWVIVPLVLSAIAFALDRKRVAQLV